MKNYTADQLSAILINSFRDRNISPDYEFAAAAGQDYGYVAAWELPCAPHYVLAYGDNGQTDYTTADNVDDLAAWLESPDLDAAGAVEQLANVRGELEVDEADEDADCVGVLITSYFYGPTEHSALARGDHFGDVIEFVSYAEAQEWIDEMEDGPAYLGHNESGAPTYKIVKL